MKVYDIELHAEPVPRRIDALGPYKDPPNAS